MFEKKYYEARGLFLERNQSGEMLCANRSHMLSVACFEVKKY